MGSSLGLKSGAVILHWIPSLHEFFQAFWVSIWMLMNWHTRTRGNTVHPTSRFSHLISPSTGKGWDWNLVGCFEISSSVLAIFFRFFRLDLDPEFEEYTRSGVDGIWNTVHPPSPTKRRSGDGDFLALPFLLVSLPRGLPVLPSTILVLRDVPRWRWSSHWLAIRTCR